MSKIVLTDVSSGFQLSKINENFQKIEDELNNKVLYRDAPIGEPNALENNLDINGKSLYNIGDISLLEHDGFEEILAETEAARDVAISAVTDAQNEAISAAASAIASGASAAESSGFASDAEISALSAAASAITAAAEVGALAVSSGAALVGFMPSNTGASASTVQTKLREIPSIPDFWRTGDGSDYSGALQRAMDSGEPVITGLGRTYTVGGGISGRGNLTLRDIVLDAPGLSSNAYVIDFSGTEGTAQTLAADYSAGVWTMTVPDGTAFVEDGWAFIKSDEYWASAAADNVKYGEYVQVAGISGNVLTFYGSTLLAYTTAAGATITPISMLQNINIENFTALGPLSTGNQGGLMFRRCGDVELRNVKTNQFDYSHIVFEQSVRGSVHGGGGNKTGVQEGLDYGVVVSKGCFDILIDGYRGDSMRHIVTIGGSQGVSRFISAINCRGTNLTDAGMDSHSASYEHTFAHNFLHFSDSADATIDGISTQGGSPIIEGNQIYNCKRHGVAWMPETLSAFTGPISGQILNNKCRRPQSEGSVSSVLVSTPASGSGYAPIASVTVSKPHASGFSNNVLIQANAAAINKVVVDGVQCDGAMTSRSVSIYASGAGINGVEITGGHHENAGTTNSVIGLTGVGANRVKNWRITSPHLKRDGVTGAIGIALVLTENGSELGTTTENVTTKYSVDASSSGYSFDRSKSNVVTYSAGVAYTVTPQDEFIIINRAGTVTVTLPDPTNNAGRELSIKTIQAQAVNSASANVTPIADATAGTSILPATDGAWALLKSDGTNWIMMQRGS